jgi:hypothetical protein
MCLLLIVQHYKPAAVDKLETVMSRSQRIILFYLDDNTINKRNKVVALGSYPAGERAA